MGEKETVSPTHTPCDWNSIDWDQAATYVRKLRQAIFRATKEGDLNKVRTLQRIMLRSFENRVLSVRRVTQINQGKSTAGVDRQLVTTSEARGQLVEQLAQYKLWKPLPAKRVYIPKANGEQRPLGIPVVVDRAIQAMVKNALGPFWEAKFEDSSYGFRPGRGCHDAIERIYNLASAKGNRRWVLDADIKGAFDNIDHDKLLELIGNFPARGIIREWLKAGYMEGGVFHDTESGTPQGGVISPLLANIAFHGMEEALGVRYRVRKNRAYSSELHPQSVGLVRYADDFVVRLLIKPSEDSVKAIKRKLKQAFRDRRGFRVDAVIGTVNPILRGWANYFRIGVSAKVFSNLDRYLFTLQKQWVNWQHPTQNWTWKRKRYLIQPSEPFGLANCQLLEPCAGKLARTVLRGGSGGNVTSLPDR